LKKKYLIGASALLLALCFMAVACAATDDNNSTDEIVLASGDSYDFGTIGVDPDMGTITLNPSSGSVTITMEPTYLMSLISVDKPSWLSGSANNGVITLTGSYPSYGSYDVAVKTRLTQMELTYRFTLNIEEGSSTTSTATFSHGVSSGTVPSGTVSPITAKTGETIHLPGSSYTHSGYTQKGWRLNSLSGTFYNLGASYTLNSDVKFYAVWEAEQYTITFDANGGSGSVSSITADSYTKVTLPAGGFTRPGYVLSGWNSKANPQSGGQGHYDLGGACNITTFNLTLYAEWRAEVCTVSFNANGGTGTIPSQTVKSGTEINLPQSGFTNAGYILAGWNLDSTSGRFYDIGSAYAANSDAVMYASWVAVPTGDYGAPAEVKLGEKYSFSPNMQSSVWGLYIEVSGNTNYSISYDGPDWLSQTGDKRQLKFEGTPAKPGVYHVVISLAGDNAPYINASKAEWYITVTEDVPGAYTVTFDANGGTGSIPSMNAQPNNAVILPSSGISRSNYTLIGWSEGSASGPTYNLGSIYTVSSDIRLYAKWTADSNLIVFDANGGTGDVKYLAATDDLVTLPDDGFTKSGYTLAGWYLSDNPDVVYAPGYTYIVSGQTTIYAYWIAEGASCRTVTYSANGGTGNISVQKLEAGKSIALPISGFNRSGFNLSGWSTESGAAGSVYRPGEAVSISDSLTLYAQWEESTAADVTVIFNLNGGSGSIASQTVKSGSTVSKPPEPVKDGYVFTAWRVVGGSDWDFSNPVKDSMTLVAQWNRHFTVSSNYLIVSVSMGAEYAGMIHTVDWGDGTTEMKTGSTFSHSYSSPSAGRITITTALDDQSSVSSSLPYNLTDLPVYTVTFINGSQIIKSTVLKGERAAEPEIDIPSGCRLTGWYTDTEFKDRFDFKSPVTQNITLYAEITDGETPADSSTLYFVIATFAALILSALALAVLKVKGLPVAAVIAAVYAAALYCLGLIG